MSRTNVLLLGKTGCGKSSLGNALLGTDCKKQFAVSSGMVSASSAECEAGTSEAFDLTVVDTPDILMYRSDPDAYRKTLSRAFELAHGQFHAILILIRLDVRLTTEEQSAIAILKELFGQKLFQHAIVVFTHCDDLMAGEDRSKLNMVLHQSRSEIKCFGDLLRDCENRFCPVGKEKSDEEMNLLRKTIKKLQETDSYCKTYLIQKQQQKVVQDPKVDWGQKTKVCDII